MAEYVCGECGERNEPGTEFCVSCHAFLAWEDVDGDGQLDADSPVWTGGTRAADPAPPTGRTEPEGEEQVQTILVPRGEPPQDPRSAAARHSRADRGRRSHPGAVPDQHPSGRGHGRRRGR